MDYNLNYDICSIFIFAFTFLCILWKKGIRNQQNKLFISMISCALLSSIFDFWSAYTNKCFNEFEIGSRIAASSFYLSFHSLTSVLFVLYILSVIGVSIGKTKLYYTVMAMPYVAIIVLLIQNIFTLNVFSYDTNLIYHRGPLMAVLYVVSAFYILYAVVLIVRYRRAVQRSKRIAIFTLLALAVISILIQMLVPILLIEMFAQSLAFLGLLLATENDDEIRNSITGIYNRKAFMTAANASIMSHTAFYTVTVKIQNPTYFNTTLGVLFMNGITRQAAQWLERHIKNYSVYDCEYGHFTVIMPLTSPEKAEKLASIIQRRFLEEWMFEDISMVFPTQICVCSVPEDADNLENLMLLVDAENDTGKKNGEIIYAGDMTRYRRELALESALYKAVEEKSLKVYYQPIYNCEENRIVSAEALVRLFDESLGPVSPEEFIPLSEKNGLIIEIGSFVLEEVFKFIASGQADFLKYIEVNLSVVQCMHKNLIPIISGLLDKYHIEPSKINLEITESAAVNSPEMLIENMSILRKMGFGFSLDDYGTGYSNIAYLFNMPFDLVKLDKCIVWMATTNSKARVTLKNTVQMVKELNMSIVAEGIESEEHIQMLKELGCEYLQGFYYSKPIDEDSFVMFCNEFNTEKVE